LRSASTPWLKTLGHPARKLAGSDILYRVRVGDYRIVYEIHDNRLVIIVIKIGHRRQIYR
jgi:mRNA interferase RelE/StbE